jgi:hypothetical protein
VLAWRFAAGKRPIVDRPRSREGVGVPFARFIEREADSCAVVVLAQALVGDSADAEGGGDVRGRLGSALQVARVQDDRCITEFGL